MNWMQKLRRRQFGEQLETRCLLASQPIISEFVADNDDSLLDALGESPDWIEIFNPGGESIDLNGWHLTDDRNNLQKWSFPETEVPGGGFQIVFASGQNNTDAQGNLHTNFRLATDGDYLGLVKPDGQTIVSQWSVNGENFSEQFEDVSYGTTAIDRTLLGDTTAQVLIPTAEDADRLGNSWTGGDEGLFTAAGGLTGWISGTTGVGHEPADPLSPYQTMVRSQPSLLSYYTFDGDNTRTNGIHDVAGLISQPGTFKCLARFDDGNCRESFVEGVGGHGKALSLQGGGFVLLGAVPEFIFEDESGTIEAWLLPNSQGGAWFGTRSELASGPGPTNRLSLESRENYSGFGMAGRRKDDGDLRVDASLTPGEWAHVVYVFQNGRSRFYLNGQPIADDQLQGWQRLGDISSNLTSQIGISAFPRFSAAFHGKIDEMAIYDDPLSPEAIDAHFQQLRDDFNLQLGTNVAAEMRDVSPSAWMRFPFTVDDSIPFTRLQLNLRFSDGFVAYLNGIEVARHNAPESLRYDSSATEQNDLVVTQSFNISHSLGALRDGENLLTIHGLNRSATDDYFYVEPRIIGTIDGQDVRFFTTPTPGRPNTTSSVSGVVQQVTSSHPHGFYDEPFDLTLSAPTVGSTLIYTTNGSVPTLDNGTVVTPTSAESTASVTLRIDQTVNVRAAAFRDDWQTSKVNTQTYLLLRDENDVRQLFEPLPEFVRNANDLTFSFNEIVFEDPNHNGQLIDYLKEAPIISVSIDPYEFVGSEGIYNFNSGLSGREAERAISIEYFDFDGPDDGFQADAALRISGHLARGFLKKPLRIFFREEYGDGRLNYPLFPGSPVTSFDQFALRSGGVDAFSGSTDEKSMMREPLQFTANLEMGQPTPRVQYTHLLINGRYWGVYYVTERPEEDFAADHIGGDKDEWDIMNMPAANMPPVVKAGSKAAWDKLVDLAESGLQDPVRYQQVTELVDIDNFIDHLIVKMFYATGDWGGAKNYFMGRRPDTNQFYFFNWDSDFSAGNPGKHTEGNFTGIDREDSPARIYQRLRENPEFRIRFADRIHQHLFNDGVLTTERNLERFNEIRNDIARPMVMELIRWGSSNETPDVWNAEVDWLRDVFLAERWDVQMRHFREAQLYPRLAAAEFTVDGKRQHGGQVAAGAQLMIEANGGSIYYTTDGSDPRLAGGAVNPQALAYEPNQPINLPGRTFLRARQFDGNEWSAVTEAEFNLVIDAPQQSLRIGELHYHPAAPSANEQAAGVRDADEFEFIELVNISSDVVDLSSVKLVRQSVDNNDEGVQFDFASSTILALAPDERVVVVENATAFAARYGNTIPVAGQWQGGLSNAGERIKLIVGTQTVHDFAYDDAWHPSTDGGGFSLTIIDPAGDLNTWDEAGSWKPSDAIGGTPGRDQVQGDLDGDGAVGTSDIDRLYAEIRSPVATPGSDLNHDGTVDQRDVTFLITDELNTVYGDVNLDGRFDEGDLVQVFTTGKYEDSLADNATYGQGDWNGDGKFTSEDIVLAFQFGGFTPNVIPAATPSTVDVAASIDDWQFNRRTMRT